MKRALLFLSVIVFLSACGSAATPMVVTATPAPATQTPLPPVVLVVTATSVSPTEASAAYPTETLYTDTPTWRDDECPNAPTPQLKKGEYALVTTTDGDRLRMREEPHRSAKIVYAVDPGRYVLVLGGYDCNDGWIWWPVKVDGVQGWASEGTSESGTDVYWLVPVP